MNTLVKKLATVIAAVSLILLAANATAKKPVKPPDPEPTDPGSLCADSGSFFPAFAYTYSGDFTGEIFLSNSAGDCTISIYTRDDALGSGPYRINYRFFSGAGEDDGYGRIVWKASDENIVLLEFQVEAKAITTPLPLTPKIVLRQSDFVAGVSGPQLSPDGNRFIVSAYETDGVRGYIWEFNIPESGAVAIDDIRELARLDVNEDPVETAGFSDLLYGLSDQHERIYFNYDYPDRKIGYIEKGMDGWSKPVLILEYPDIYPPWPSAPEAVGLWDFGSGLKEVLSIPTAYGGNGPILILDVDACVESKVLEDCVVLDSIQGFQSTSFTTRTEGQLPALLYRYVAVARNRNVFWSIRECNLSVALDSADTCYRTVIEASKDTKRDIWGIDSAD